MPFNEGWNEQIDRNRLQMKRQLKTKIVKKKRNEKNSWSSTSMEYI